MPSYTINSRGQRQYKPGTEVGFTTALSAGIALAPKGIVSILFEASRGGEPLTVTEITSGPQLTALLPADLASLWSRILFTPGSDQTRTKGGIAKALLVRVNPATQAYLNLNKSSAPQIKISAADWGLYGNQIQCKVEDSGTTFTAKLGTDEYVVSGGDLPMMSLLYTAPASVPVGWAVTAMTGEFDPNAADGDPGFEVKYAFTGPQDAAGKDPRAWMAFDGPINVAIGAQAADVARDFVFTGTLKVAYGGKLAGDTDTETLTVASSSNATTVRSWSEVTLINPPDVLDGNATYTGSSFVLPINTTGGDPEYNTVAKIIDRINQKSARGYVAAALTADTAFNVTDMDSDASPVSVTTIHEFDANLYDLIEQINANAYVVTAERVAAAIGLPDDVAYTNLANGADNFASTTDTDWTDALVALEDQECNEVIPITTSASVNALVLTHCLNMTLNGLGERSCSLAVPANTPKGSSAGQLYALSLALNSRLVSLHCQTVDFYNESGVETTYDPYVTAMITSALEAGRDPNYGITNATVNGIIRFNDYPGAAATNWTVKNDGDALIEHGYCLLTNSKKGIRVLRGNTNYHGTEEVYSSRVAVELQLRAATTFRETMENVIGTLTLVPKTIIKGLAADTLDAIIKTKLIVDWDENSLVLTESGAETQISVMVQLPVERLWVRIAIGLRV